MHLRFVLSGAVAFALVTGAYQPVDAKKPEAALTFTKLWTHGPTTPGQVSEIPAFDPTTNTIWVVGIVGVDVVEADTGALVTHIDVTPHGAVNSVAISNGLAALAIEAASQSAACPSCDRRNPGTVLFYDTATLMSSGDPVNVDSLPDMVVFTHDGSKQGFHLQLASGGFAPPIEVDVMQFQDSTPSAVVAPGSTLVLGDTSAAAVYAYPYDGQAGTIGERRVFGGRARKHGGTECAIRHRRRTGGKIAPHHHRARIRRKQTRDHFLGHQAAVGGVALRAASQMEKRLHRQSSAMPKRIPVGSMP